MISYTSSALEQSSQLAISVLIQWYLSQIFIPNGSQATQCCVHNHFASREFQQVTYVTIAISCYGYMDFICELHGHLILPLQPHKCTTVFGICRYSQLCIYSHYAQQKQYCILERIWAQAIHIFCSCYVALASNIASTIYGSLWGNNS